MEEIIYKAQINSLIIKAEKELVERSEKVLMYDGIQMVEDPYTHDDLMIRIIEKDGGLVLGGRYHKGYEDSTLSHIIKTFKKLSWESYSLTKSEDVIIAVSPSCLELIRLGMIKIIE